MERRQPPVVGVRWGLGIMAIPAGTGLALTALTPSLGHVLGIHESTIDLTLAPISTSAVALMTIAAVLRREDRRLRPSTVGLAPIRWALPRGWRGWLTPVFIGGLAAVIASPLRRHTIDLVWEHLPGPAWSVNSTPAILDGEFPVHVTWSVLLVQLLIRQPFTVLVEEALTQGFLYPRMGRWAPLKVAALRALYHSFMWWSVPAILPYSLAISLARWYFGNPWPGIAVHYTTNIAYFIGLLDR